MFTLHCSRLSKNESPAQNNCHFWHFLTADLLQLFQGEVFFSIFFIGSLLVLGLNLKYCQIGTNPLLSSCEFLLFTS